MGVFVGLASSALVRQMVWPWGSDGAYFLQRAWEATQGPVQKRTLLFLEQGHGAWGGRHHSPIISLFAPFVALWPRYATLLVVQAAVLGLGVLPLFALCWRATEDRVTALLLLAAAVSVPGFLAIGVADFRLVTPALALVPAFVLAVVFGPWPAVVAATVVACSAREEVAPLLLAASPWLVWERSRRSEESLRESARILLVSFIVPALLWQIGTSWRLHLYMPNASSGFSDISLATLPQTAFDVYSQDLRGTLVENRLIVGQLQVLGLAAPLLLLRPLAALPLGLFWFGAGMHAGVVNHHQLHYYAPLVGLFMALIPLAVSGPPNGTARRKHLARGLAVVLVVAHFMVPFYETPVPVRIGWASLGQELPPEWELAERIGPTEQVVAAGWLLPLIRPRRHLYESNEFGDVNRIEILPHITAAFLIPNDNLQPTILEAGFEEVARTNNAILYRRPGTSPR